MIIAVCPECYRAPSVTAGGFMRCPEHGICHMLTLVHVYEPPDGSGASSPGKNEDAPVIGKCRAKVTSANSPERGKRCNRPARFVDDRNRPVCGYHRPTYLQELRERNPMGPGRRRKKKAKRKRTKKARK